jgi:hypothetical protein
MWVVSQADYSYVRVQVSPVNLMDAQALLEAFGGLYMIPASEDADYAWVAQNIEAVKNVAVALMADPVISRTISRILATLWLYITAPRGTARTYEAQTLQAMITQQNGSVFRFSSPK